jgi:ribosomal protein L6P/L9E
LVKSSFVGFKRYVKVKGVGYKFGLNEENTNELIVKAGLTHPITQKFHSSLDFAFTRKSRMVRVRSVSLFYITDSCSSLRNKRKPNVFTGKGIRFRREKV